MKMIDLVWANICGSFEEKQDILAILLRICEKLGCTSFGVRTGSSCGHLCERALAGPASWETDAGEPVELDLILSELATHIDESVLD
jgi:hypothetical protein